MGGGKVKKRLLFITSNVFPTSAQGIRYTNLIKYLSREYEIHHITYNKKVFEIESCYNEDVCSR